MIAMLFDFLSVKFGDDLLVGHAYFFVEMLIGSRVVLALV
jgi:hypothetical protein